MFADDAAVEIVAAAGLRPHQDRDGLALVEFGDGLRRGGRSDDGGSDQNDRCANDRLPETEHSDLP